MKYTLIVCDNRRQANVISSTIEHLLLTRFRYHFYETPIKYDKRKGTFTSEQGTVIIKSHRERYYSQTLRDVQDRHHGTVLSVYGVDKKLDDDDFDLVSEFFKED